MGREKTAGVLPAGRRLFGVTYRFRMKWLAALAILAVAGFLFCDPIAQLAPGFEEWTPPGAAATTRPLIGREPCAQRVPAGQAFFGDLHVHTGLSMDTRIRGGASTPDEAYRFARGQEIRLSPYDDEGRGTRPLRLDRPLDFAAVTDHAEWLGETSLCVRPGSPAYTSSACRTFRGEQASLLGDSMFARLAAVVGVTGRHGEVCGEDARTCRDELTLAWTLTQAAAERHYDRTSACRFTTFHAWEYSASPGRSKVHRNVILRNEIVPELPISWIDEPEAEGLWRKLRERCNDTGTGCEAIAIPHNPNLSNGKSFVPDRSGSLDEQRERAQLRAELEPLVEMMQAKGESECRSGFAGVLGEDDLCELDKVRFVDGARPGDCGEGTGHGAMMRRGCQSRLDFARYVLLEGLVEEARLGVNPYRLGWIGGTDTHNGTPGATAEAGFAGHNADMGVTLEQRLGRDSNLYAPAELRSTGGLMGVWAEENTRDALFDAMKRRETFATSGTRIVPRFVAAASLPDDFCEREELPEGLHRMGEELSVAALGGAPQFGVWALRDAGTAERPGTLLQRIQIVKGWVDDEGLFRQEVHDVAGHEPGAADVDRATCQISGPGSARLCAVWSDPAHDPSRPAIYYARILENPTCRWSGFQCAARPVAERPEECDAPHVPWKHQERAWTSAIWLRP